MRYILPTQYYSINTAKINRFAIRSLFCVESEKVSSIVRKDRLIFAAASQFKVFKPVCHSDAIIVNKLNMHEAP